MKLENILEKHTGFTSFRGLQKEIIQSVLDGNNTLGIMPTGIGKSICYQLPALHLNGTALIISPLIALMADQVSKFDDKAVAINSSMTNKAKLEAENKLHSGLVKMMYIAPESLSNAFVADQIKWIESKGGGVSFIAVDESHTVSAWGADFRVKYQKIPSLVKSVLGRMPTTLALTATATKKVQDDVMRNLSITKLFRAPYSRPNLKYSIRHKIPGLTESDIVDVINDKYKNKRGIVYCFTRKETEAAARYLIKKGIKAAAYHAGFPAKTRTKTQELFNESKIDVIVATIAFGLGIDVPDIRFVIHYTVSSSPENYLQETGRAGRDGKPSECILFYSQKDVNKMRWIVGKKTNNSHNPQKLLDHIIEIADKASGGGDLEKLLIEYIDG